MAPRRLPRASQLAPLIVRVLRVLGCVVRVFGRLAYVLGRPAYVFGRLVHASVSFGASLRRTDTVTVRDGTDVKKAHNVFLGIDTSLDRLLLCDTASTGHVVTAQLQLGRVGGDTIVACSWFPYRLPIGRFGYGRHEKPAGCFQQ
jgi:hypothetical protein